MVASCIPDFSIPDITRPKPKRFKKQMFALINFLRFSEHQIQHFDELKEDKDKVFSEKESLGAKVAKIEEEVEREEETRKSQEGATLRLRQVNAKLTDKLKVLQEEQKMLRARYDDNKKSHGEAKMRCDGLKRDCDELASEIERLQMRIDDNPTQLRDMIESQKRRLRDKEQASRDEESKAQGMAHKKRVLEGLETDIGHCAQLVKSCLEEQMRLTREVQELDKIRSEHGEMAEERDNLTLQLDQARQRLAYAMERLEKTQRTIETRREDNKRKVDVSNDQWHNAQREKRQRGEQAEALNRQVATIEAEYDRITRDFDAFYTTLSQQKDTLERQSKSYMQAIAQRMDLQVDIL